MKFDDETCSKNMITMLRKGYKIFNVEQEITGQVLHDGDVFRVNDKFMCPLTKVVFPTPVLEEVYRKGKNSILSLFHW